ncbi:transcription factor MYB98 [Trifolium repens]|nr:transcription factor MYB98 [Trifolium repens]
MIPTPSYKAAHNNGSQRESMSAQNPMMYAPNNNKMEPVHGRLNTSKGVWDLSQKNLFKYGETSQPQVDLSLPLSPVYDAQPSMSVKPEHQGDLSFDGELKTNAKKMIKDSILVTRSDIRGVKGIVKINARIPIPSKADGRRLRIARADAQASRAVNSPLCRERWNNHLRSKIKKSPWSEEEEKVLIEAHKRVGNKWTQIARKLPGRTENAIKNHWNTAIRCQNRQNRTNRWNSSKKTILQKYINEVNSTKEVEEEHAEDLATQKDEQLGGYEEMMFNNGDDRMASGFGTMDFEFENGMEFFVEVTIKEEMDFMEMINNNP